MENEKIHFCLVRNTGFCSFYNDQEYSNIPSEARQISLENKNILLNGINNENKRAYIDDSILADDLGSQFKLRDKDAILINEQWTIDQDAIKKQNQQQLINQSKNLLMQTDYWDNVSYRTRKTKEHLSKKDLYRNTLRDIINGIGDSLPEKP